MGRYIIIRTVWIFIVIFIILSLNFVLLKLAPSFPPTTEDDREIYYARQVKDGYFTERLEYDTQTIIEIRDGSYERCDDCYYKDETDKFRIYEPVSIPLQYFRWVGNIIFDWNWGLSTRVAANVPVFDVLTARMAVTLKLNFLALFFYIPIGFVLGIIAALKKNTFTDNLISFGVMIFISVPSFVTMTILIMVFGYQLDWLPSQFVAADVSGLVAYKALVLPVLGLSFGAIAGCFLLSLHEGFDSYLMPADFHFREFRGQQRYV